VALKRSELFPPPEKPIPIVKGGQKDVWWLFVASEDAGDDEATSRAKARHVFGLTDAQVRAAIAEGLANDWPLAPPKDHYFT
jgi:hypothetical protein